MTHPLRQFGCARNCSVSAWVIFFPATCSPPWLTMKGELPTPANLGTWCARPAGGAP